MEIVKSFRQWLVMSNKDGTEYTVWPERVAEIDAVLTTIEQEGAEGDDR